MQAEGAVRMAQSAGAGGIPRAESAVTLLESKVSAAQSAVGAALSTFADNVRQTQAQVTAIEWALEQAAQSNVGFQPGEDLVGACQVQLLEQGDDGPKGVLFLTDARILLERKEQVATKKVLFITTAKETVQEAIFAIPIGQIKEVKTGQAGFLGHKELMEVAFTREAPLDKARLRLFGADNDEWTALIGRVKSGEIAKERTRPKDEATVQAAREAPTKCPTCGALFSASVVKGMQEITCQYCGAVVRL
jgi:hypothetical protein